MKLGVRRMCRITLAWLSLPAAVLAAEQTASVALTHAEQPVRLAAVLPGNVLRVATHDQPSVAVSWSGAAGQSVVRLVEDGNAVTLEVGAQGQDLELRLLVPANTSLSIRNEAAGSILVEGLRGDQEIESRYGDIVLREISGSAVLAAYHGSLEVAFSTLDHGSTNSFITFKGDLDLRLPADPGAQLSMTLNSVRVQSDFSLGPVDGSQPSVHVLGAGRARIDLIMNEGNLWLRRNEQSR